MKRADKAAQRQKLDRLIAKIKAHLMAQSGLSTLTPKTLMGKRAMVLTESVATYAATLSAVAGYTAVVQSVTPPPIQEQTTPTDPGVSSDVYDEYMNQFLPLWDGFQSVANQWMLKGKPNSQGFYTQLSSVPNNLLAMNYQIGTDLNDMIYGTPGTSTYDTAQSNLEGAVSGQSNLLQGLIDAVQGYSNDLATATDNVIQSANSGALYDTIQEYQSQIDDLNDQISTTTDALHDDEKDLLKETAAGIGFIVMAVVGMVGMKTKDPATKVLGGLITIAGGIGFASEIYKFVESCIAISKDLSKINVLDNSISDDQTTATALGVLTNQIDGFAGMEAAAIEALQEVLNAYAALSTDLDQVATDASDDDPQSAQTEWNDVMDAANNLVSNLTYFWPDIYNVYECKSFAPTTSGLYTLASDGTIYEYTKASGTWSTLPGQAVSLAATDDVLVRINAAPLSATSTNPTNTYFASQFDNGAWQDISDFAVGNISAYGANIYAVRSSAGEIDPGTTPSNNLSEVLQYSGSGTTWTSLGAPNDDDAPGYLAACEGGVIATTVSSGQCYFWNGSSWTEIGDSSTQYLSPTAAQSNISMTDINYNAYLGSTSSSSLSQTEPNIYRTAIDGQSSPTQYAVTASGELESVTGSSGNYQISPLKSESLAIYGDTTGQNFYMADINGNIFQCKGSGSSMTFSQLPDLPDSND